MELKNDEKYPIAEARFLFMVWKKRIVLSLVLALLIQCCSVAGGKPSVEYSKDLPVVYLVGSRDYSPTPTEEPYHHRPAEAERITIHEGDEVFDLRGKSGKYVSWFGVVRQITRNEGVVELLVENKYDVGISEFQIQSVSINGAGDFLMRVSLPELDLAPLQLVRVYGQVSGYEQGMPVVETQYVRIWIWGQFNFRDWGVDKSNPKWRDQRGTFSYSRHVVPDYYRDICNVDDAQFAEVVQWLQSRSR